MPKDSRDSSQSRERASKVGNHGTGGQDSSKKTSGSGTAGKLDKSRISYPTASQSTTGINRDPKQLFSDAVQPSSSARPSSSGGRSETSSEHDGVKSVDAAERPLTRIFSPFPLDDTRNRAALEQTGKYPVVTKGGHHVFAVNKKLRGFRSELRHTKEGQAFEDQYIRDFECQTESCKDRKDILPAMGERYETFKCESCKNKTRELVGGAYHWRFWPGERYYYNEYYNND